MRKISRFEKKYLISEEAYIVLKSRLKSIMVRDEYCDENGCYSIRNIYFDTYNDKHFNEHLDGIGERNKYRLRIYNLLKNNIFFEQKNNNNGLITKKSFHIDHNTAKDFFDSDFSSLHLMDSSMYAKFSINIYKPKIMIDYIREAFFLESFDIRITIDSKILTGFSVGILQKLSNSEPIYLNMERMLEIKFKKKPPVFLSHIFGLPLFDILGNSKYINGRLNLIKGK